MSGPSRASGIFLQRTVLHTITIGATRSRPPAGCNSGICTGPSLSRIQFAGGCSECNVPAWHEYSWALATECCSVLSFRAPHCYCPGICPGCFALERDLAHYPVCFPVCAIARSVVNLAIGDEVPGFPRNIFENLLLRLRE